MKKISFDKKTKQITNTEKSTAQNSQKNQSMENKYEGKDFSVYCLHTFNGFIDGYSIFFKPNVNDFNKCVWMMEMHNPFQNPINLMNAIRYIDTYCSEKSKQFVKKMIEEMVETEDKGSMDYCRKLGFFCELGVWKDKKQINRELYHKDFPKYFSNCRNNYFD